MDPETVVLAAMRSFNTLTQSMGLDVRVFILAETNSNCYISGDMGLRVAYKRSGLKGSGEEVDFGDCHNLMLEKPTILRPAPNMGDVEKAKKEQEDKAKKELEDKAKKEHEDKAIKDKEEKAKKENEEKAKKEKEVKATMEKAENAKKEKEEKANKEKEGKAQKDREEKAKAMEEVLISDDEESSNNMGPVIKRVRTSENLTSARTTTTTKKATATTDLEAVDWLQNKQTAFTNGSAKKIVDAADININEEDLSVKNVSNIDVNGKIIEEGGSRRRPGKRQRQRGGGSSGGGDGDAKTASTNQAVELAEKKRTAEIGEQRANKDILDLKEKERKLEELKRLETRRKEERRIEEEKRKEEKRIEEERKKMLEHGRRPARPTNHHNRESLTKVDVTATSRRSGGGGGVEGRPLTPLMPPLPLLPIPSSSTNAQRSHSRDRRDVYPTVSSSADFRPPLHDDGVPEDVKRQVYVFETAVLTNSLDAEMDRFKRIFDTPEAFTSAAQKIIAVFSKGNSVNLMTITYSLFNVLPNRHACQKMLFEILLYERYIVCSIVELALGLGYYDPTVAGAILVDSLSRGLVAEMDNYLAKMDQPVAESAVEFVASLLGMGPVGIAETVKKAFGFKKPSNSTDCLRDEELVELIKDICGGRKKSTVDLNIRFPRQYLKYRIHSRAEVMTGWYRRGEIERNEVVLYFEEYIKDGDLELALKVLSALSTTFPALAQFLDTKWNIADAVMKNLIRANLYNSLPLTAQSCNDNETLHSLVSSAGTHHIGDLDQWREASATMRKGSIVSIAVGEALDPANPRRCLGAVAFFVKLNEYSRVGNLYFIQPSLCGAEMAEVMFKDLEQVMDPGHGTRILLFSESIFLLREFAFLKRRLRARWILDVSRITTTGGRPATMDNLCQNVTGGTMCNRTKQTMWSRPGGPLALQHLGIRCVIVMEYAIKDRMLKSVEVSELKQSLVAEWDSKYGIE